MYTFSLDPRSGVPTYLQLVQQVRQSLRLGLLNVGDQLPTAKEVVADLAINPNTVLKAYRELEREGLVEPRPGLGTFVVHSPKALSARDRTRLRRQLERWVASARSAGLDEDDMSALIAMTMSASAGEQSA